MRLICTIKFSLAVHITIFLVIGLLFPANVLAVDPVSDGIWSDTFTDYTNLYFIAGTSVCEWKSGLVQLSSSAHGGRIYSFNDSGSHKNNQHRAYDYQLSTPNQFIFSFLYPLIYTPRILNNPTNDYLFNDFFQYDPIEQDEGINKQYAPSSSEGTNIGVVQQFRMKLQGSANDIGNLYIYWCGYAKDAKKIEMYYLDYSMYLGVWKRINSTQNISYNFFRYNLSQAKLENAIDNDNYINICVVATKESQLSPQCTLYTNYVELESIQQKGYKIGHGFVQTRNAIPLRSNTTWELFTWDDFQTDNATVRYQILYNNGTKWVPVQNSILKGNDKGFAYPPISLAPLADDFPAIKIQANLTTKDSSVTPKIFSWAITWQSKNQWCDYFSSDYRIENKNLVDVESGVNISLVSGYWPMFGQNPANTRASIGKGANAENIYWYSDYQVPNITCGNLVVDHNALYLPVTDQTGKGLLYKYSPIIIDSTNIKQYNHSKIIDFSYYNTQIGKKIIGSPAISDRYIIVATGDENTINYVYAFDKENPSESPIWRFDFSTYRDATICYWGSPIIADGKIFLTSWNGNKYQPTNYNNNMVLALNLTTGELLWNRTFPPPPSLSLSPTWSFSTPAYSEGKIVVGCMNNKSNNLFAFDAINGTMLWNISVGAIGKASPVIFDGTVYIINEKNVYYGIRKKTKVTAINIDDGTIRWEKELGQTLTIAHNIDFTGLAQSTPAIANGVLYTTSPDGCVTAFDLNGTELWTNTSIYSNINRPTAPILTSSPAYADNTLYVGTPDGTMYALNTLVKGKESSHQLTFPDNTPIVTNPVVVDGLLFFGAEDGKLYVCGNYIASSQQISGSITSIPIQLPEGVQWKKFYASVQTNASININKITFSLLDVNKNLIKVIQNKSDLSSIKDRTIRLHADLWAKNDSFNPKLISWNITFSAYTDKKIPFINMNTLDPNPKGWLNAVVPQFTVKVQDNDSGLLVNSAKYVLGYKINNQTYLKGFSAQCSGVNGTTSVEQLTINISKLDFYKNITALVSLRINITDLAGNTATKYLAFQQDTIKPSSYVSTQSMKLIYNATAKFVRINATSFDNGTDASGIKQVILYYRYSSTTTFSGDWIYFANSTKKSPQWKFNFTNPSQHGGYFEICTVAIDNASNTEAFPTKGDVSFLYDWTNPDLPIFSGETIWLKERFTSVTVFEDDFRLDTIEYRPNFETLWTTIATDINTSTYEKSWSLKEEFWDQMNDGQDYYLFFKINDTVGNTRLVTSNNQAINIRKDTVKPIGIIEIPTLETDTSTSENFTIIGFVNDQEGSGIKEVSLLYRYSADKSNWSSWTIYGDPLSSPPFEWAYIAQQGDGYYDFRINVTDVAGNSMNSEVIDIHVFAFSFPITLTLIMVCLLVVFSILTAIIVIKWRKIKIK